MHHHVKPEPDTTVLLVVPSACPPRAGDEVRSLASSPLPFSTLTVVPLELDHASKQLHPH